MKLKPEQYFYARDGSVIKSLTELRKYLERIDKNTFNYHVTKEKNDFANWVEGVFKNKELASAISLSKTREEMLWSIKSIRKVKKIKKRATKKPQIKKIKKPVKIKQEVKGIKKIKAKPESKRIKPKAKKIKKIRRRKKPTLGLKIEKLEKEPIKLIETEAKQIVKEADEISKIEKNEMIRDFKSFIEGILIGIIVGLIVAGLFL